ncbi:hypothetical protein SEA_VIBAKI_41 [Arthrobacter phage Vibaki]|uniref:Uncharacterized protein n=1 Tax=Arthrobacter phage Vibaki TaxID=2593333 RepID=A0A514TZ01_9CAUD|nr:hypothetical protein HYP95_gp41 [Arthrobacter phage Vibaki]QDK01921.1 hypothetical protein SEA_VIBAKI_41 [Arthrobacter phage Vibaki]
MDSTPEHRPGPARDKYSDLVAYLKKHPAEWVKLRTASTNAAAWAAAHQIRTGRRAAFRPAGEFEAYTQGPDIVVRYIGPQTTPQDGTK